MTLKEQATEAAALYANVGVTTYFGAGTKSTTVANLFPARPELLWS